MIRETLISLVGTTKTETPADPPKTLKIGLAASIFGCWHMHLSRPRTSNNSTFRICSKCSARQNWNPQTLKPEGRFYYPAVDSSYMR